MRRPELRLLTVTETPRWAARLVAIFLLVAAALVVVGVSIESASGHFESAGSSEHGEIGEGRDEPSASNGETGSEPGLGGASLADIPLESPLLIGGLAATSLVLAIAISLRPARITATLAILFSIAAGVFDVSEIQHQASDGSAGLLTVAVLVVALRVLAIVGSVLVIRGRLRPLRSGTA